MLDQFLLVAHRRSKAEQEKRAFIEDLKKLPRAELEALANGEAKLGSSCAPMDPSSCGWLDRFKGTPLFESAVALEQQELQLDAQNIQRRMQQPPMDYAQEDQIRLQKRLLELQLAQMEEQAAHTAAAPVAAPNTPPAPELTGSQGAGAVGAEELDNTEAVHNRPAGSPGLKLSSADFTQAKERMRKTAVSTELAKKLAHADAEKIALSLPPTAALRQSAGNILSKLGPQGTKALVGAGLGAAGGAVMGGHDDRGWHPGGALLGALGGAGVGAAAGHIGGNVADAYRTGMPLSKALGAGAQLSGRQAMRAGRAAVEEGRGLLGKLQAPAEGPSSLYAHLPGPQPAAGPTSLGEFLPGPKA